MGGLAFASEVFTPRMPPDVYRAVRDRCQEKLRELFLVVATPIEGPAKTSFGDIDLFVAWRRDEVFPSARPPSEPHESTRDAIYRVLGATKCKIEDAMILAIPWPSDFAYPNEEAKSQSDSSPRENAFEGAQGSADIRPPCIQVDVHVCGTLDKLQFMLFKHAHGDLWNILGSTIRQLGLTIDEKALYIRIPEIEETDKKKARVPLSTDPSEILSFLGLSVGSKEWEQPFDGDWEVFEYVATSRLFAVRPQKTEPSADDPDDESNTVQTEKQRLKANDRRRMASRPLFRRWVEEFLPACRDSGRFMSNPPTRDGVREQAFEYFPGVQAIYNSRIPEWRIKRQQQMLVKDVIKPAVPVDLEASRRGCCMAALKKVILDHDASFGGIVAPAELKSQDGLFNEDAVRVWVENNWERVLEVAWAINQERYRESQERKGTSKRTVSGSEKSVDDGLRAKEKTQT